MNHIIFKSNYGMGFQPLIFKGGDKIFQPRGGPVRSTKKIELFRNLYYDLPYFFFSCRSRFMSSKNMGDYYRSWERLITANKTKKVVFTI